MLLFTFIELLKNEIIIETIIIKTYVINVMHIYTEFLRKISFLDATFNFLIINLKVNLVAT